VLLSRDSQSRNGRMVLEIVLREDTWHEESYVREYLLHAVSLFDIIVFDDMVDVDFVYYEFLLDREDILVY